MHLWVGLGNPGQQYAGHRHNIGFMAIEAIARYHNFGPERSKFSAIVQEGTISAQGRPVKILLMKPQTFMNESGRAIQKAMAFYKIPLANVNVIHDELDLVPFKLRMKMGGGIAGHNGLRSIRQHVGADFQRMRLGIGHPGHKDKVHHYVLSDFCKSEHAPLNDLLDRIAKASDLLAAGAPDKFQTKVSMR